MLESVGDRARGHRAADEVNRQQDLASGRVRQRIDNDIQRGKFCGGIQGQPAASTGVSLASDRLSSTLPIGSQTAMTSGVWWAIDDAASSFH